MIHEIFTLGFRAGIFFSGEVDHFLKREDDQQFKAIDFFLELFIAVKCVAEISFQFFDTKEGETKLLVEKLQSLAEAVDFDLGEVVHVGRKKKSESLFGLRKNGFKRKRF